jgi:hypothetical protein
MLSKGILRIAGVGGRNLDPVLETQHRGDDSHFADEWRRSGGAKDQHERLQRTAKAPRQIVGGAGRTPLSRNRAPHIKLETMACAPDPRRPNIR